MSDHDRTCPAGGVRRFGAVALELLLGAACPGCQQPGPGLCPSCRAVLAAGRPYATRPQPAPAGFPYTVTAGPYDDLLHQLIPAHKERQVWTLTGILGDRLADAATELLQQRPTAAPIQLVPIPSTPAAVRARGRDATAAIAGRAARRLTRDRLSAGAGPVTMIKLLRPVRRLADQSELAAAERRRNLAGAYGVRPAVARRAAAVILVDDLVTTGSSLAEARRAVAATGIEVIGAAVVAATVRHHPARAGRRDGPPRPGGAARRPQEPTP